MVRKSAAKIKPIKVANSDKFLKENQLPPIEDTFEKMKQGYITTLETAIKLAERVDNLLNIRDYALKFWGNKIDNLFTSTEELAYYKELQDISVDTYRKMLGIANGFELSEFLKDDMVDYFEPIMPKVNDILTTKSLCAAGLEFLTIKPFGEKMAAMHHTILDEKKQREAIEKEFGE